MFIDEKGKLFGKINLIDFFVVLFLLSLAPVFYYGYKVFNRQPPPPPLPPPPLAYASDYTILLTRLVGVDESIVPLIKVGDVEKRADGKVIAEILDVIKTEDSKVEYNFGTSKKFNIRDNGKRDVLVRLKVLPQVNGKTLYYHANELKAGSLIYFKTADYKAKVHILSAALDAGYKKVKVVFDDVLKEIGDLIKVGDEQKNEFGFVEKKIEKIIRNEPAKRFVFSNKEAKYIYAGFDCCKDIEVLLNVSLEIINGRLYSTDDNVEFLVGHSLRFRTGKYFVKGDILAVE